MVKIKKEKIKEDYNKLKKGVGSVWSTVKSEKVKMVEWEKKRTANQLARVKEQQVMLREQVKLERERMKLRKMKGKKSQSGSGDMFKGLF